MTEKSEKNSSFQVFLRSLIITISAISLLVIGYFGAGFFFGKL